MNTFLAFAGNYYINTMLPKTHIIILPLNQLHLIIKDPQKERQPVQIKQYDNTHKILM